MKTLKLALIGCGNVGKGFIDMLALRQEYIQEKYDTEVLITAVCTRRLGGYTDPAGIDMKTVRGDSFDRLLGSMDVIDHADYDVMVELTPLNIRTGQPAIDHIRHAILRGKHVITANKGPIAWSYRALADLAEEKGVHFLYEATLMDGVPVYNLVRETLQGCRITAVSGIFNATTNYILGEMEAGRTFEEAIASGREQGFVEADPSMDIDGWDAAAKLTALMNVVMDAGITPDAIDCTGIGELSAEDIVAAAENGQRYKLLCRGSADPETGRISGVVAPELVDSDSIYSSMNGTCSCVTFTTDLMGDVTMVEHPFEPEINHTAYGILSDLLRLLTELNR
ncbi:MAG: homoserine dehydrogenase [Eubacterium sp.]|nr:homoserine dehydrogenase [Eubacterium sp.]